MSNADRPAIAARLGSEAGLSEGSEPTARRRRGVWSRFRQHRLALAGTLLLVVLTLSAIAAPLLTGYPPNAIDLLALQQPPSSRHWLGTDAAGRDILSRLLYAGRVSLSVGLVAVSIYVVTGVILGGIAGFYGGWVESIVMRLADMVLSFPAIVLIITIVSVLGPSIYNVMLVIGLLGWPPIARLVRGDFLSLREREFVLAARAIGAPNGRIIFQHVMPNAAAPVIVAATFGIAQAILLEAGLSFLGLGVQPPTSSWGNMLKDAQSITVLESMPWLWLPPGAMIALAVLSINFLGDGLRDALDPHLAH
ncbi:MAG: ABC transporter permease [Chloroflexota bacterium]|nr:ABC transporter permease [Chloroflexota bacterium]